jgi:two-component system OmpR family response regulator
MTPPSHILVVDDDRDITELLAGYLSRFSMQCHTAANGSEMRTQLAQHPIELVVMDLMLPGENGLTLAREIRLQSALPVIMLTARCETFDRVVGLENGADDYVSKPFEPRELVARIQTVLRRTRQGGAAAMDPQYSDVVNFDGWELHRDDRCLVSPTGVVVALSNAEFRLLAAFLRAPRRLLSRDQLMEQARGRNMDAFERSIDLLVSRLRQKLVHESLEAPLIKTVRGAGYMLTAQTVQGRMAWPQRA